MRGHGDTLLLIAQIALRNLLANRRKTAIMGGLVAFAALLVVLGAALTEGVDRALEGSITHSYAGHVQVYSSESKDELEVAGSVATGLQDLAALTDVAAVRKVIGALPNVKAVVPMGISGAMVSFGNPLDESLARLRATVSRRLEHDHEASAHVAQGAELERDSAAQLAHVRQLVAGLARDLTHAQRVTETRTSADTLEVLRRASAPEFWSEFAQDPYERLEFLENNVTPLASDAEILLLRYLGTDPGAFARAFDRMTIVDGGPIPQGQRGFLFSKYVYEDQIKLRAARGFDKLKRARDAGEEIAADAALQALVRENVASVHELLLQLDPTKTQLFRQKLQGVLGSREPDLRKLMASFFAVTDRTLDERYAYFYRELAPHLQLYRVRIGDHLTIQAITKGGYARSANLKVYGTFTFKGLESSPLAGTLNLMDLVSFRDLYGFMTAEREEEIAAVRARVGARDIAREDVERELFGTPSDSAVEREATRDERPAAPAQTQPTPLVSPAPAPGFASAGRSARAQHYDPSQLVSGVALNAAVVLRDETKIAEAARAIEAAAKRAGLPLKAISWRQASGVIGQLATLLRAVLYSAVLVIFLVALVVINNSLVMATLERVTEIGTLRAIGAQRRFVLLLLACESSILSLFAGGAGALLGALILVSLGVTGIPAQSEAMSFFFAGPRLHPALASGQLGLAMVLVLVMSAACTIYPAWLALRVSPREAMHAEE